MAVARDFYDVLTLASGSTLFLVGDVSGKGIPAALFLASVRTLIRHFAAEITDPGELLQAVNNRLAADNPKMMFVTLLLALVQPDGGIVLSSGGHPPPARIIPGTPASLLGLRPGRLLGIDAVDRPFPTTQLRLSPGERLLMYTDGVNEAPMADDPSVQFGNARLWAFLDSRAGAGTLGSLHEQLCAELTRFCRTSEFEDDVTLLSLRRNDSVVISRGAAEVAENGRWNAKRTGHLMVNLCRRRHVHGRPFSPRSPRLRVNRLPHGYG